MPTFYRWARAMGFRLRQVALAGREIGLESSRSSELHTGKATPNKTQLLAMSAARVGLEPWSPDYDEKLKRASLDGSLPIEPSNTLPSRSRG